MSDERDTQFNNFAVGEDESSEQPQFVFSESQMKEIDNPYQRSGDDYEAPPEPQPSEGGDSAAALYYDEPSTLGKVLRTIVLIIAIIALIDKSIPCDMIRLYELNISEENYQLFECLSSFDCNILSFY